MYDLYMKRHTAHIVLMVSDNNALEFFINNFFSVLHPSCVNGTPHFKVATGFTTAVELRRSVLSGILIVPAQM